MQTSRNDHISLSCLAGFLRAINTELTQNDFRLFAQKISTHTCTNFVQDTYKRSLLLSKHFAQDNTMTWLHKFRPTLCLKTKQTSTTSLLNGRELMKITTKYHLNTPKGLVRLSNLSSDRVKFVKRSAESMDTSSMNKSYLLPSFSMTSISFHTIDQFGHTSSLPKPMPAKELFDVVVFENRVI